ncbi:acyl-coenzyme A thioesterase 8 [Elysia marginata]|uniref:Acyl-coenzyme A thioesterase 8 n=1 Tax=Elysia marginata TaxID=1093978 RepID=A0AAV4ESK9_9GAST|nr:acyl-coenzyme A thioesterase 8 [Elysia marginata]
MDEPNSGSEGKEKDMSEAAADKELGNFIEKSFLDLEKIDDFLYRSKSLWKHKTARGVYGGQVIGQALVAASECIPSECHMHSMHSYFLRPGNVARPILYHVDVTRAGRTYCSTAVKAVQANQAIFTMQASFKREEENHSNYQISMPKGLRRILLELVVHCEPASDSQLMVKSCSCWKELIGPLSYKYRKEQLREIPIIVKYVKEEQIVYRTSQRQTVWLKVKGHLPDNLHPNIHKCCLAYMSDMYLMSTASMPLRWLQGTRVFVTSVDHSMWFHAPARADEWMLFDVQIDNIGDGRTLVIGHVWDLKGTLVTTIAQEGVLRLGSEIQSKL